MSTRADAMRLRAEYKLRDVEIIVDSLPGENYLLKETLQEFRSRLEDFFSEVR